MPTWFSKLHPRFRVPSRTIVVFTLASISFVIFVWIGKPFGQAVRWRGIVAILLSSGMLMAVFLPNQPGLAGPVQIVSGQMPIGGFEWFDFWPKLTFCAGALALLVLGALDIRRIFGAQAAVSSQENPQTATAHPGEWRAHEMLFAGVFALAIVCGAVNGILEIAHGYAVPNVFAVPVTVAAVIGSFGLFIHYQFARPSGARGILPEFAFVVLAACAGGLPWTPQWTLIPGWDFWEGAVFAGLNFMLGLFMLMVSGAKWTRLRAAVLLLAGLGGFVLVMLFTDLDVSIIGHTEIIKYKTGLSGLYISAVLSLLIALAGTLELRRVLNPPEESRAK